tara:strand:- start:2730 stop:3287 length:558 start_codon:yes stop_codon:yes gene_type:complete
MVNSWSLLYDELYGDTMIDTGNYNKIYGLDDTIAGGMGDDVITFSSDGIGAAQYYGGLSSPDTISFNIPSDEITFNIPDLPETDNNNGRWKYDEDVIIKDITEYVGGTYRSHYTGAANGFKEIQTIDLMAAKGLASSFCQANILKYGSRYGAKDGKSKRDLLKVIHYAMLLLHFDNHYKESDYPF